MHLVENHGQITSGDRTKLIIASCPSGEMVITGGGIVNFNPVDPGFAAITESYAYRFTGGAGALPDSWLIEGTSDSTAMFWSVSAFAWCATPTQT
jgi:hypothetical protein